MHEYVSFLVSKQSSIDCECLCGCKNAISNLKIMEIPSFASMQVFLQIIV